VETVERLFGNSRVKYISIEAIVHRAGGQSENLGQIAMWDKSLLKRLDWRIKRIRGNGLYIVTPDPISGIIGMFALPFLATYMVNGGEAITTNRIHGAGTEPLNIGWGTGTGTTAKTDTSLFTEVATDLVSTSGSRTAGTGAQVTTTNTNDTYQVTGTRSATGSGTVTNAGTFDNATIGSGNMYMKGDFTGIGLASGDSIAFTCKVQYS
jgi:hypothetical protein